MAVFQDSSFQGTAIGVDGNAYDHCIFRGCTLIFSGRAPFSMVNCHLENSTWQLAGSAVVTLQFLRAMYHNFGANGRAMAEQIIDEIRRPPTEVEAAAEGRSIAQAEVGL